MWRFPWLLSALGIEESVRGATSTVCTPFLTSRTKRVPHLLSWSRRILEFAATIKSTFEPVVQANLYPRSQIDIFIQVLQQDGGLLQACINGTTLALINAGIPMNDFICAVTGGVHSTFPILDLTLLEESDVPNVTVAVMPKTQKVSMVTMETRLHVDRFDEIFKLVTDAGLVVHEEMKRAILARSVALTKTTNPSQYRTSDAAYNAQGEMND